MRFSLLQPVMTDEEVVRLKIGKRKIALGCGQVLDERGHVAPASVAYYFFKLTGRAEPVGVQFTVRGKFESLDDSSKRLAQAQGSDSDRSPAKTNWTLVSFEVDGVLYRRNKDGLYVAESGKR